MATVDDAIRDAYRGRAERIRAIRNTAASIARVTGPSAPPDVSRLAAEVSRLAALVAQLTIEVQ